MEVLICYLDEGGSFAEVGRLMKVGRLPACSRLLSSSSPRHTSLTHSHA